MATIAFRVADLPAEFCRLPHAEQLVLIRTATGLYTEVKDGLYASWSAAMTADETTKAEQWREEGRKAASAEAMMTLQSVTAEKRLMAEALVQAEAINVSLRDAIEKEAGRRLAEKMDAVRTEFEMEKMREMVALRERLATLESREKYTVSLEETVGYLKEKVGALETKKDDLHGQLMAATVAKTRSSHMIGKIGEATVLDMLENTVLTAFPYSTVKDMTTVSHAADFHLWVMTPKGKRVKMLVDSKKYKRNINSDEINKLIADVDADEEAECGIMISLDSPICTMKQFQIKNTMKHKPVIYLTFQDLSEDQQRNILCWAVHALLAIVKEISYSARNYIVDNIDQFLGQINETVKEMDGAIRLHMKALDAMRQTRMNMVTTITNFRKDAMIDGVDESSDVEEVAGCVAVLKATGTRCGKPVMSGTEKCRAHAPRKGGLKDDAISHVE